MGFFKRVEEKYFLNEEQYQEIIKKIEPYFIADIHGFSNICNIYFDTDNYDLIVHSIDKPKYKEKVRLRSYGIPKLDSLVYLEVKRKYKGIVSKRRISMTLNEFNDYFYKGIFPKHDEQIMKEIDYTIKHYKLKPRMFVGYDRIAYYDKTNENFRLTFDFNIQSREKNLKLNKIYQNEKLYDFPYYVMEVKALDSLPLWFVDILSELKIYPCSFSKYGTIYRKKVLECS